MRPRSLVLAMGIATAPRLAFAVDLPHSRAITVGPSFAFAEKPGGSNGLSYGVDAAASWSLFWAGGGARLFESGIAAQREFLPYLEAGVYLFVNFGGGYTFDVDSTPDAMGGPHVFVGLPLTTNVHQWNESWYWEPYYRPTFADAGPMHEFGILVKGFILSPDLPH